VIKQNARLVMEHVQDSSTTTVLD